MELERTGDIKATLREELNEAQSKDEETRVSDRLKKFVQSFVEEFENKNEEYLRETKPGVKTKKAGRIADAFVGGVSGDAATGGVQGVEAAPSALDCALGPTKAAISVTQSLISTGARYFGRKHHRTKAKQCVTATDSLQEDEHARRRILAEAGFDIFQSFEKQFSGITDTGGNWRRGIEKLARDAVGRVMNYFSREIHDEQVLVTSSLITEAVILGESKKNMFVFSKPGHTIKFEQSGKAVKSSEIYSKTGLVKIVEDFVEFYKKKGDDVQKYGYRLIFDWESKKWENELKEKYNICESPGQEYKYIIKGENREDVVEVILKGIDDENKLRELIRTSKDTNKTMRGVGAQLTDLSNDMKTLLKKDEDRGSVSFNVRDPLKSFTGRRDELERLHNLLQESSENETVISRIISICGLGGVGKTQLVRQYIHDYCHNYDNNILWMNAENHENLTESFRKLAEDERVGISTNDVKGQEKDVQTIVDEVYRYFANRKSLFVFDNAENYRMRQDDDPRKNAGIETFLPPSLIGYAHKPQFIITSRNQNWPDGIQILPLYVFIEEDAVNFIRMALTKYENRDEMITLAETLQYLPLALQQALVYIRFTNEKLKITGCTFDMNDYLKRYEEKTKELLGFKFPEDSNDIYLQTTLTTWEITTDKMRSNSGEIPALNILDIIAYIAPDNIPAEMFLRLEYINNDREKLGDALQPLLQYSIIHSGEEKSSLNVHRLVQQVTRIKLSEGMRIEEIFRMTLHLLERCSPNDSDKVEDIALKRKLLPHLEVFLTHIEDWSAKEPEYEQHIEIHYTMQVLKLLCEGYRIASNYRREKDSLVHKLAIEQKYLDPDHLQIATTLANLATAYCALGEPHKQKELNERALAITERHYGPNHFQVALILVNLSESYNCLGDHETQKVLLERALQIQEEHYGPDHSEIVITLLNLGNAYGALGDPQKHKILLQRSLAIGVKHHGRDHFLVGTIMTSLGNAHSRLGNPQKQKELLKNALAILEKHFGPNHFEVAYTMSCLAKAYGDLGEYQKEKELLEDALAIQEKYYGPDHFKVAGTLVKLGNAYDSMGDPSTVKELLDRALVIQKKYYGSNHFEVSITLTNLGTAYGSLGDIQKMKELLENALAIRVKYYGPNHFEVACTLVNLGNAHSSSGDYLKAKELLERALTIEEKHYGPNHFQVANILTNLGNCYGSLGDFRKQMELLEKALTIQENHYGPDHSIVANTLNGLACAYGSSGDLRKKMKLLERALAIFEKHYQADNYVFAEVLTNLSNAHDMSGDHRKQEELLERVLAIYDKHYGPDHFKVADTLLRLSYACFHLGNPQKQEELLERALTIRKRHCGLVNERLLLIATNSQATVYEDLGDYRKAYELYQISSKLADKQTPLQLAARRGKLKTVEYILEKGDDVLGRNIHHTVLHCAANNNNVDVIRLILDRTKEKDPQNFSELVDAKDGEGDTPLMWAAEVGNANAAKVLLEYGADLNIHNNDNMTALDWAKSEGHPEIAQLLLDHNAKHSIEDKDEQILSTLVGDMLK